MKANREGEGYGRKAGATIWPIFNLQSSIFKFKFRFQVSGFRKRLALASFFKNPLIKPGLVHC
jgi:hypothetical protein